MDIVVLNEFARTCHGCLLTKKEDAEIMSIHTWGNQEMSNNSILAAFEINYETGKYENVNPENFEWRDFKNSE